MTKTIAATLLAAAALATASPVPPAAAAAEPFLGEIMFVAFKFCPRGWAKADGSVLPINQNIALFSLLGTTYGGNGQTTFKLPHLRKQVVAQERTESGGMSTRTLLPCIALQGVFPPRE
jgi:microcystin-dependent protein